jgi:hypothetical protein
MTKSKYAPLLLQLRMLADQEGDHRSLVAIAAAFERQVGELFTQLTQSVEQTAHCRNGKGAA